MSGAAVGELGFQRRKHTENLSEPPWGLAQLSVLLREVNEEEFGTGWKLPCVTTASGAPAGSCFLFCESENWVTRIRGVEL